MKKMILAVIAFIFLVLIGNWPGGTGIKDPWDELMSWSKNKKSKQN